MRLAATALVLVLILFLTPSRAYADGNRLAHLDHLDPYYVSGSFPKLITPQWVGEPDVECVVVLAIDDMRDTAKYERYLRPILDRLRQIDGRSPVSIMTNSVDANDSQIQSWLREGLSIEVHTIDHPCPLLSDGDLAKAKSTYDRCVDLMASIPGNDPVAFRMPCCDSLNTPSPRFWNEIFESATSNGQHLSIDSSVFNITNDHDWEVPQELVFDPDGRPRFQKYLPFPSFVNTIENYPYPYVIGRTCWEFPCVVPSDWEAQNLHQPNNPKTVSDLKTALDVIVRKKGTFNLVFHPHGWIRAEQVVELIDHAEHEYGNRVKFLTFRECNKRLKHSLLDGYSLRANTTANGNSVSNIRLFDIDGDGYQDVLRFDPIGETMHTRIWRPAEGTWMDSSSSFDGEFACFGITDSSNAASIVVVDRKMNGLRLFSFSNEHWMNRKIQVSGKQPVVDAKNITGLRLRDLNGDGVCEILVGSNSKTAVLRQSTVNAAWTVCDYSLPANVKLSNAAADVLRLVDVDEDGDLDCLYSDAESCSLHLFESMEAGWSKEVFADERSAGNATIPPFVRADGTNNGAWIHSGQIWYQNEDTSRLPDKVDRRRIRTLLDPDATETNASVFPLARSPAATLASITTSPGVSVELVAAEPMLEDPVAFDWDVDGSLWVVEMRDYPNGMDGKGQAGGRVKHLIDEDGDGRYDRATVFLDHLPFPTGVKVWKDGILVTAAPDILFAKDTDGDGKADQQEVLFTGFGQGNQQHRVNGLVWGMDGWLYVANGDSGGSIASVKTKEKVAIGGRDIRINPDTGEVSALAGPTQFGRCVDSMGNWFGGNNSSPIWHYVLDDHYASRNPNYSGPSARRQIQQQPGAAPVFPTSELLPRFNDFDRANRFTSACSPMIYRDSLIGQENETCFFVCEPVHNLVHREVVTSDGISFHARRPDAESRSEFLASSDNWCRPVMVRTGPDGCLWIADMYRLVIEHPEWIPTDWQRQVDVRSGTDRGRIYRVVPDKSSDNRNDFLVPLDQLSTESLVRRLEHPNGWQRDTAQQLLLWRNDPNTTTLLAGLLESTDNPVAKVYCLHTLSILRSLQSSQVIAAIDDTNDDVARHAMKLAEPFINDVEPIGPAIVRRIERAHDLSPLHQQAAYTLGEWKKEQAGSTLTQIAFRFEDPQLTASVISSIGRQNINDALAECRDVIAERHGHAPPNLTFVAELLRQAILYGEPSTAELAAQICRDVQPHASTVWKFASFRDMQAAMGRRETVPDSVRTAMQSIATDLRQTANRVALDTSCPVDDRVAAVRMLADDRESASDVVWENLLTPQQPPELNLAAVDAIIRRSGTAAPLLRNWPGHSPRLRAEILDRLLDRSETTLELLEAIQKTQIPSSDIGLVRQHQLRRHKDERIQQIVEQLFGQPTNSNRTPIVDRYVNSVTSEGNFESGAALFKKHCATCHRLGDEGSDVGPDLAALSDKSPKALLTAILDPNRSIEDRYISYNIQTNDGLVATGVISDETSNAITLFGADGKRKTVLRNEIDSVQSSGTSLMPEGFEKELSADQVSDVIAFLRQQTTPRKIFPGNEPRVAPVRNDGSIRLFALHAQIFGPSLAFEDRYRNLGFWGSNHDRAVWELEVPETGDYSVGIEYACDVNSSGNRFLLTIGDQSLSAAVESTGSWDSYGWRSLGTIRLTKGPTTAVLRSSGPVSSYLMDYRTILLNPK